MKQVRDQEKDGKVIDLYDKDKRIEKWAAEEQVVG